MKDEETNKKEKKDPGEPITLAHERRERSGLDQIPMTDRQRAAGRAIAKALRSIVDRKRIALALAAGGVPDAAIKELLDATPPGGALRYRVHMSLDIEDA